MPSLTKQFLQQKLNQTIEHSSSVTKLQSSAVLVLVVDGVNGLDLVLTRRAYHLKNHPGQISFAGGTREKQDDSLYQTALREAEEEIGLPTDSVEILGSFEGNETITGFYMTPIVGFSLYKGNWQTDPSEVHSMLTVPLDWAMKPDRWREEAGFFRGKSRSYLAAWWQGQLIWGATAQLLDNLRKQLT